MDSFFICLYQKQMIPLRHSTSEKWFLNYQGKISEVLESGTNSMTYWWTFWSDSRLWTLNMFYVCWYFFSIFLSQSLVFNWPASSNTLDSSIWQVTNSRNNRHPIQSPLVQWGTMDFFCLSAFCMTIDLRHKFKIGAVVEIICRFCPNDPN